MSQLSETEHESIIAEIKGHEDAAYQQCGQYFEIASERFTRPISNMIICAATDAEAEFVIREARKSELFH